MAGLGDGVGIWVTENGYATNLNRTLTRQVNDLTSTVEDVHRLFRDPRRQRLPLLQPARQPLHRLRHLRRRRAAVRRLHAEARVRRLPRPDRGLWPRRARRVGDGAGAAAAAALPRRRHQRGRQGARPLPRRPRRLPRPRPPRRRRPQGSVRAPTAAPAASAARSDGASSAKLVLRNGGRDRLRESARACG